MRTLKTISQREKIALVCKIVTILLFVAYTVFFMVLFYRQYWYGTSKIYQSDLHPHIKFGKSGKSLYSLTYIILAFLDSMPRPGFCVAAGLTFFLLLGVVATKVLLQYVLPNQNKWIVWAYAWMSNMFFPFAFNYVPLFGTIKYRGMLNFNVYHNPTYIMMKPFAIFSVFFFFRLINKYHEKGIKVYEWFIFSGLMLLTTFFKPNFMIGFSLSMLCVLIIDFIRHRGKKILNYIVLGTTVFPSIALMLYQQATLFDEESQLKIGFMTGLKALAKHPEVTIPLSLVFPVIVLIFSFKDLLKDRFYMFAWLHMIVNLGITFFVYETGHRLPHGNFIWSSFFAVGLLFIVSLTKFNKFAEQKKIGQVAVMSGVLGINFFNWLNYVFIMINGGLGF